MPVLHALSDIAIFASTSVFFFQAGSPAELLADPKSLFSALVKNDKGAAAQVGTPKPSSENLAALA
jgi:hypothetical protein